MPRFFLPFLKHIFTAINANGLAMQSKAQRILYRYCYMLCGLETKKVTK